MKFHISRSLQREDRQLFTLFLQKEGKLHLHSSLKTDRENENFLFALSHGREKIKFYLLYPKDSRKNENVFCFFSPNKGCENKKFLNYLSPPPPKKKKTVLKIFLYLFILSTVGKIKFYLPSL